MKPKSVLDWIKTLYIVIIEPNLTYGSDNRQMSKEDRLTEVVKTCWEHDTIDA